MEAEASLSGTMNQTRTIRANNTYLYVQPNNVQSSEKKEKHENKTQNSTVLEKKKKRNKKKDTK